MDNRMGSIPSSALIKKFCVREGDCIIEDNMDITPFTEPKGIELISLFI